MSRDSCKLKMANKQQKETHTRKVADEWSGIDARPLSEWFLKNSNFIIGSQENMSFDKKNPHLDSSAL